MKTRFFMLTICAIACLNASAQFKYDSNGVTVLGDIPAGTTIDTESSLKIFPAENGKPAAITFGDGNDLSIGKLSTDSTTMLKLHSKNGFIYTSLDGDTIVSHSKSASLSTMQFISNVSVWGYFYNFRPTNNAWNSDSVGNIVTPAIPVTALESVTAVSSQEASVSTNATTATTNRFDINVSQLKSMFPNLVVEKEGQTYVDYTNMIPVLINAISELKAQLDNVTAGGVITTPISTKSVEYDLTSTQDAKAEVISPKLFQNAPNPFNAETIIKYILPDNVSDAILYIYNMQGTQVSQYDLTERGENSVIISASELSAGMYFYTLIVDGKEIDTKRMILTR